MISFNFIIIFALICFLSFVSAATVCTSINQVTSNGVFSITANGCTQLTFYYFLPSDCPSTCGYFCNAGCLLTSSANPQSAQAVQDLDFDLNDPSSWIPTSVYLGASCSIGGGIGAVSGDIIVTDGLSGTYGASTGTRIYSSSSSCGVWKFAPTNSPSRVPSRVPSNKPTLSPTEFPSRVPSSKPSLSPTEFPSRVPSNEPSLSPTEFPSRVPSNEPSLTPTEFPSRVPSFDPTQFPLSQLPSNTPSQSPTFAPTEFPSVVPTLEPSTETTQIPSTEPTQTPSFKPSFKTTVSPTSNPTSNFTFNPTSIEPTASPTILSTAPPSLIPSNSPTKLESREPTMELTIETSLLPPSFRTFSTIVPSQENVTSSGNNASFSFIPIVVGVVVGLVIVVCVTIYCLYRMQKNKENFSDSVFSHTNPMNSDKFSMLALMGSPHSIYGNVSNNSGNNINSAESNNSSVTASVKFKGAVQVPIFSWNNLQLFDSDPKDAIIGSGSFGVVIKAKWKSQSLLNGDIPNGTIMAVKVIIDKHKQGSTPIHVIFKAAMNEAKTTLTIEERINFKNCISKVYGIAEGQLPREICKSLGLFDKTASVGIIMRYEAGGSLQAYIHSNSSTKTLGLQEKLKILTGISRGLAELHAAGIVHGDLKPDNVLLSDTSSEFQIRLVDFGLSTIRGADDMLRVSTLEETKHLRGTPIYCAPEMLHNPYHIEAASENFIELLAKPSRKTDMYAFAILCWEVLTQLKPFKNVKNETTLSSLVHQGQRPDLSQLPNAIPWKIVDMIESCWNFERSRRKTAIECFSILQYQYLSLSTLTIDIFISSESSSLGFSSYVLHYLTRHGLKVNLSCNDSDTKNSRIDPVCESKLFVVIANKSYIENEKCMNQLREAKESKPPKPIIPIFIQENYLEWINQDFRYLCQMLSPDFFLFDVSESNGLDWESENGPNQESINILDFRLQKLVTYVSNLH